MISKILTPVLLATLPLALIACRGDKDSSNQDAKSKTASHAAAGGKTLYERLGGEPAIRAVVDDFVARSAPDPQVNFTRKGTGKEWNATPENVQKVKDGLVRFIAQVVGGPQNYEGRDMKNLHRGMKITNAEFNALAAHLKASLDKFKVPAQEQSELLTAVEGTRKDIVELK
jgi:hemoglobin